jgi:hypothetical protein
VERGSQELRDAFYVYAGLDVSVDDLYRAFTDQESRQQLIDAYNQGVIEEDLTWEVFVDRATKVGLDRLATTVRGLVESGVMTPTAAQQILGVRPQDAKNLTGALAFGSEGGDIAGLEALVSGLEYAMLASAATEQGLQMPTRDRLEEFRQAGVRRADAIRAYGTYAARSRALSAAAERANLQALDQGMFEEAALLGRGEASAQLNEIIAAERALGQAGGGFGVQLEGERIVQRGR